MTRILFISVMSALGLGFMSLSSFAQVSRKQCSRSVLLNAIDKDGNRVAGLKATDFVLTVNGQDIQFELRTGIQTSPVLIVLQTSRSMKRAAYFEFALLQDILAKLPGSTEVGVMVFSDKPKLISDFTLDRKSSMNAFASVVSGNSEWKYSADPKVAIEASIDVFDSKKAKGNIIFLTNGTGPLQNSSTVTKKLQARGVRLYAFLWDQSSIQSTVEELAARDFLTETSSDSGGARFWASSYEKAEISTLDMAVAGRISYPYQLIVTTAYSENSPIKVRLRNPRDNNYALEFPRKLPTCINSDSILH